jgi:membrane-bound serine protease (ClpP class)
MLTHWDANAAVFAAASGYLLICAEFCLPGWVVPGVTGGVCLVCGLYRLAALDCNGWAAAALAIAVSGAAAGGYGLLPRWSGLALALAVPWLCRALVPGAIGWAAAGAAAVSAGASFVLLQVAAVAARNKTIIQ